MHVALPGNSLEAISRCLCNAFQVLVSMVLRSFNACCRAYKPGPREQSICDRALAVVELILPCDEGQSLVGGPVGQIELGSGRLNQMRVRMMLITGWHAITERHKNSEIAGIKRCLSLAHGREVTAGGVLQVRG